MAHEITDADGIAYNADNGVPWHGLGVPVAGLMTAIEALDKANLGWAVEKEPVFLGNGEKVPAAWATVRKDNGLALGVVGDRYTVVNNTDAFGWFDALTFAKGGPRYETAGSLHRGRKVWMLAKLPEAREVVPGDVTLDYLLLTNSHDGSSPVSVCWTSVRVVCQNTLTQALNGAGKHLVRLRHTTNAMSEGGQEKVRETLGLLSQFQKDLQAIEQRLAAITFPKPMVSAYLSNIFPTLDDSHGMVPATLRQKNAVETQRAQVMDLFDHGPGQDLPGVAGTAYAMANAVTDYGDHYARLRVAEGGTRGDQSMASRVYGTTARWKADSIATLRSMVGVK